MRRLRAFAANKSNLFVSSFASGAARLRQRRRLQRRQRRSVVESCQIGERACARALRSPEPEANSSEIDASLPRPFSRTWPASQPASEPACASALGWQAQTRARANNLAGQLLLASPLCSVVSTFASFPATFLLEADATLGLAGARAEPQASGRRARKKDATGGNGASS